METRESRVDVTVQLICQKTRTRGAGRQLPRQSVCTVNWQRIGGLACNSTGKLSAFQTSLYAGRTHTSRTSLCSTSGQCITLSRFVMPVALKASTSYPYFGTRIIILTPLTTPCIITTCETLLVFGASTRGFVRLRAPPGNFTCPSCTIKTYYTHPMTPASYVNYCT